jgi:hypothetical protein
LTIFVRVLSILAEEIAPAVMAVPLLNQLQILRQSQMLTLEQNKMLFVDTFCG